MNVDAVRQWAHDAGLSSGEVAAAEAFVMTRMGNRELVWLVLLGLFVLAKKAPAAPQPVGPSLTLDELRNLAAGAGFAGEDIDIAAAIAMAESGGHPGALNVHPGGANVLPEHSIGLWQVNVLAWPQFDRQRLTEPAYNAQAAFTIRSTPRGWGHWSVYSSGAYKKYLPVG